MTMLERATARERTALAWRLGRVFMRWGILKTLWFFPALYRDAGEPE